MAVSAFGLGALSALGQALLPPALESFSQVDVPTNNWWSFSTNGQGRIQVVYDAGGTDRVTTIVRNPQPALATNLNKRFFADVVHCTSAVFLARFEVAIDPAAAADAWVGVYYKSSAPKSYELVYSNKVAVTAGWNTVASGDIGLALGDGAYVVLGACVTTTNFDTLVTNALPASTNLTFGQLQGGLLATATSSLPATITNTPGARLFYARVETSTDGVLRLDDGTDDATYSTNAAILKANLLNRTNAVLSFRLRELGDESHADDGVFLSTNGTTFSRIVATDRTDTNWHFFETNLYRAAQAVGMVPGTQTWIKIQQMDNYAWPTDGYEIDDVFVGNSLLPDLESTSLSIPGNLLLRGTNLDITFAMTTRVARSGGLLAVSNLVVTDRFMLYDPLSGTNFIGDFAITCNIPPDSSGIITQKVSCVVPAATRLTNLVYAWEMLTDAGTDLTEADESNNLVAAGFLLNQYSGRLLFGDVVASVVVTSYSSGVLSPTNHTINGTGTVAGLSFTFSDLDVIKDRSTLDYTVTNGSVWLAQTSQRTNNGVLFLYTNGITLDATGARADVLVKLPAGFGWSASATNYLLEPAMVFSNALLATDLGPARMTNAGVVYVCEETKPVRFRVLSSVWDPGSNRFLFARSDADGVRKSLLDELAAYTNLALPEMRSKKSNEGYFRFVSGLNADVAISIANGTARLNTEIAFSAGTNVAHFPLGVTNAWTRTGAMRIEEDMVALHPTSMLRGASSVTVRYDCTCPGLACGASHAPNTVRIVPAGSNLLFTGNGGLYGAGTTTTALMWGARSSTVFAHSTTPLAAADYYMPGHFLVITQISFAVPIARPAELLLAGLDTNNLGLSELVGFSSYKTGLASYAGANVRVASNRAEQGRSTLGGTNTPWYDLTRWSKYYVRQSGVSGIHEAMPDGTTLMQVYGYAFSFTNFALSFLSGVNLESKTDGGLYLPYPTSTNLAFTGLKFDCLGDLGPMAAPSGLSALHLDYWNADLRPYAMRFERDALAACGTANASKLVVDASLFCGAITQTLYGTIGFQPSGNLITRRDNFNGIDSRLTAPGEVRVRGPTNEFYSFRPMAGAYLNNYTTAGGAQGMLSLAGELDVPFFKNMEVQIHTRAGTNITDNPDIYMMGGWPTEGWTDAAGDSFFTSATFDDNNDAYPTGLVGHLTYRTGADGFRPRALRTWLEVVDFNYPLAWSKTTRTFKSSEPAGGDLLVLHLNHQVDYMGPRRLEISFGAKYDGIPRISVVNLAVNAVDETTGMASCFVSNGLSAARNAIMLGVDDLGALVDSTQEEMLDAVMDRLIGPVVDNLYTNLYRAYTNAPDSDFYSDPINRAIAGAGGEGTNCAARLQQLTAAGSNLTGKVQGALSNAVFFIDAFALGLSKDPLTGLATNLPPLLDLESDRFPVLAGLAEEMVQQTAEEAAAALASELNERLQRYLAEARPTLDEVRGILLELREVITNLQGRLNTGGDFLGELQAAVPTAAINDAMTQAAEDLNGWCAESFARSGTPFTDYTPDEIKARIRQAVKDRIYASNIGANLASLMRSRVSEVNSMMQEQADTVFQQINLAIREVLADYCSELDNTVNQMLGKAREYAGSGKVDGYAHLSGDSLSELRLDTELHLKVPTDLNFKGYLIVRDLNASSTNSGCSAPGSSATEVTAGARDVEIKWGDEGLRADVYARFSFQTAPVFEPLGFAGGFALTSGGIGFESFRINSFAAAVAFGQFESYLSAGMRAEFGAYQVGGGVFFGRTCTLDPILLWDQEVVEVLGQPPFAGIYAYGEGWMPIYNYGCPFRISAGAGAGFFYFVDGPIGGRIMLGASGEAICCVNVKGEVRLAGAKNGDDLRLVGRGKISGKAGPCPLCVKFGKQVKFTYINGTWDADY